MTQLLQLKLWQVLAIFVNYNPIYTLKKSARQIFGTVLTILRHGTHNFQRVNVLVPHVMLKILRVPRLPPRGSLGTGK